MSLFFHLNKIVIVGHPQNILVITQFIMENIFPKQKIKSFCLKKYLGEWRFDTAATGIIMHGFFTILCKYGNSDKKFVNVVLGRLGLI